MEVNRFHPCARRTMAGPSDGRMPNSGRAPSAASAAPSISARSDMRYGLLPVVLIGAEMRGRCGNGALPQKGRMPAADRKLLHTAFGFLRALGVPLILPPFGFLFWFRQKNGRAGCRPIFAYSGRLGLLVGSPPAM